jgi:hypothetical protein
METFEFPDEYEMSTLLVDLAQSDKAPVAPITRACAQCDEGSGTCTCNPRRAAAYFDAEREIAAHNTDPDKKPPSKYWVPGHGFRKPIRKPKHVNKIKRRRVQVAPVSAPAAAGADPSERATAETQQLLSRITNYVRELDQSREASKTVFGNAMQFDSESNKYTARIQWTELAQQQAAALAADVAELQSKLRSSLSGLQRGRREAKRLPTFAARNCPVARADVELQPILYTIEGKRQHRKTRSGTLARDLLYVCPCADEDGVCRAGEREGRFGTAGTKGPSSKASIKNHIQTMHTGRMSNLTRANVPQLHDSEARRGRELHPEIAQALQYNRADSKLNVEDDNSGELDDKDIGSGVDLDSELDDEDIGPGVDTTTYRSLGDWVV